MAYCIFESKSIKLKNKELNQKFQKLIREKEKWTRLEKKQNYRDNIVSVKKISKGEESKEERRK